MGDFDDVLERLLTEPAFAAALAGDPDVALAGYRLEPGEIALLRSQVVGDTAADVAAVETRTNKSSTFGLLAPFAALGGLGESLGQALADPGGAGGGAGPQVHSALGEAPAARTGLGPAVHEGLGAAPREGFGAAPQEGHAAAAELAPPKGYHDRVDADGDGRWDKSTFRGTADGGVDILVDLNNDGTADFIGHDANLDHRVEYADYDKDHDGVFEKRMYDTDHDGWLDRTVRQPPGS